MPTSGLCRPGAGSGWRGQESNPDVGIIRASCGCLKPYRPGAAALSSTLEHLSDQRERGPVPRSAAYCSRKQAARGDWIMPTRRALRTLVSCANVTGQVTVRHNPQVGIRHFWGIQLTGLCQVSGSPGPGRPWALDARRVASLGRRGGWLRLVLGEGDQVPVPHRIVADGEFEYAVEDQPPAAGSAPVEAEAELVQVALQVHVLDRALVGAQQPALGQGGDPVDPGQQLAGVLPAGAGGPLAAPDMGVTEPGDPVVAHPAVGDHRRPWLDVAGEEGAQRAG